MGMRSVMSSSGGEGVGLMFNGPPASVNPSPRGVGAALRWCPTYFTPGGDLMTSVYDFEAVSIDGQPASLASQKGKVLLIVNTASACGFTPQFAGLEKLWETYADKGLVVLGFPSNEFGGQDPGTDGEIASFCQLNY